MKNTIDSQDYFKVTNRGVIVLGMSEVLMTRFNINPTFWPIIFLLCNSGLFAKALTGVNIKELITNVGSAVGSASAGGAAPAGGAAAADKEG